MINEFHSALINSVSDATAIGNDYESPDWTPVLMSNAARAVWRSLLVAPDSPSARNWRAYEIRRLLPKTDLASMLSRFDTRDGYELTELLGNMTRLFAPRFVGNDDSRVYVEGSLRASSYQQLSWQLESDGTQWTLESDSGEVWSGDYVFRPASPLRYGILRPVPLWTSAENEEPRATEPPPVSQAVIRFPAIPLNCRLLWAASPTTGIQHTATELATVLRAAVIDLAEESPSRLDQIDRYFLRDVVLRVAEPAAKVCAAALLLTGRNLRERAPY